MGAVLLDSKTGQAERRSPARGIVVAARMPAPPKLGTYHGPFSRDTPGDVVAECDVILPNGDRCGWGCSGVREEVGKAARQHHRLFHSDQTSVVLLNHARQ